MPNGVIIMPLTTYDLFDTPQGQRLRMQYQNPSDWWGHSAIAFFHTGKTGIDGNTCECNDFSDPWNFPAEIAQAIRDGKFRDITDARLLTHSAYAQWSQHHPEYSAAVARLAAARDLCETLLTAVDRATCELNRSSLKIQSLAITRDKTIAAHIEAIALFTKDLNDHPIIRKTRCERDKARDAYSAALIEYTKAQAEYKKAGSEYDRAIARYIAAEGEFNGQYVSDVDAGSPAATAFWGLFSETNNRAEAWK